MILAASRLTLTHRRLPVVKEVDLEARPGELLSIVGPNGSGKTTLLRGLARLHPPAAGTVTLDGVDIRRMSSRRIARHLAILPQLPEGGLDLTVAELVWRGRYPHQGLLQRARLDDHEAVRQALTACDLASLADRQIGQLSGGERQRAWLAMALAQRPQVLLLDEPTSFLDFEHQLQLMEIISGLKERGIAVVAVLHNLDLAARYADSILALSNGRVAFSGPPGTVLKEEALRRVFNVEVRVIDNPVFDRPLVVPVGLVRAGDQPQGLPRQ